MAMPDDKTFEFDNSHHTGLEDDQQVDKQAVLQALDACMTNFMEENECLSSGAAMAGIAKNLSDEAKEAVLEAHHKKWKETRGTELEVPMPRHKVMVQVFVTEDAGQGWHIGTKALWNGLIGEEPVSHDAMVTHTKTGDGVRVTCVVFFGYTH